ncbi:DUF3568 family protein [Poriferisphaera sp. WC338]|uniref:DUF3568 family protein n=1 Tax=Poriferisphaera sp. WC338 TaxID=3425129 RepID=UPI003D817CD9
MANKLDAYTKRATAMLLAMILLVMSGCGAVILAGAAAAGTGVGVAYYEGALRGHVNGDPIKVAAAAKEAVEEMKFTLVSDHADAAGGEVVARTAADKKVTISIEPEGDNISKVTVRVGFFGDETISRDIFDKIQSRLGSPEAKEKG